MSISLIAAVARGGVIGHENDLPWYLPEDLKRFRKLTEGKPALMGRKTFESIIARIGKPLPRRLNIVITRDRNYSSPLFPLLKEERETTSHGRRVPSPPSGGEGQGEVAIYHDLNQALDDYKDKDLFVIGGGEIFKQTIDQADTLYITHVDMDAKGDSYFPEIDPAKWQKTDDEKHENFSFVRYKRKVV